jgi:hypothetical protein
LITQHDQMAYKADQSEIQLIEPQVANINSPAVRERSHDFIAKHCFVFEKPYRLSLQF